MHRETGRDTEEHKQGYFTSYTHNSSPHNSSPLSYPKKLCGHVARYTPRALLSAHAVCVVPLAPLVMQTGGFGSDGWRVAAHFPAEAVWSWKESGRRELLRFLVITGNSVPSVVSGR